MMLALDADMLVVGSRGLSGLAGLIRGSVSQALIGNAHDCSLIMIAWMQWKCDYTCKKYHGMI